MFKVNEISSAVFMDHIACSDVSEVDAELEDSPARLEDFLPV